MVETFKISEQDIDTITTLLSETDVLLNNNKKYKEEVSEIYRLIPRLKERNEDTHLLPHIGENNSIIRYYTNSNKKLNDFFKKVFNNFNIEFFIISEVTYTAGGFALPHTDPSSYLTYNVMIDDNFEGGDAYVGDTKYQFKKKGDVICFNGGIDKHSVSEITKGTRRILSIWAKKSKTLF